jgi:hypothetical protein
MPALPADAIDAGFGRGGPEQYHVDRPGAGPA